MCHLLASCHHIGDFEMSFWLTVSPSLSLVLLWFVVKSVNFFGFALLDNFANDLCTLDEWAADLGFLTIHNGYDFGQFDRGANLAFELLDDQNVAFPRGVLLPTGLYDCIHVLKFLIY